MDIGSFFASLATLVPGVVIVTEFLIRTLGIQKKLIKQITAGLVSVAACLVGMFFNLGMFSEFNIWYTLAYAVATALGAMGLSTVEKIQLLLGIILKWLPAKLPSVK